MKLISDKKVFLGESADKIRKTNSRLSIGKNPMAFSDGI